MYRFCGFDLIGQTFGEDRYVPELGDPPDFQPSILVDGGISYVQFFKKLLIPAYARIENVKKGCYTLVDRECLYKKKETYCEKKKKRKAKKEQRKRRMICPPPRNRDESQAPCDLRCSTCKCPTVD